MRNRRLIARLRVNARYSLALLKSILPALTFCALFFLCGAAVIYAFYDHGGGVVRALYYMYFLMLAEPAFPDPPEHWAVETISVLAPLVGILVVFDLLARLNVHVFARKTNQREWVKVVASTFDRHIVLCGLGKVGSRVLEELVELDEDIVCIEREESARGVRYARDREIPVIVDDACVDQVLEEAGIARAKAVLAVTDKDLVNLEIALDARKFNPTIRVITRIFEQELAGKLKIGFDLDGVYSTSTLAAPFFAVASLDPEIINSYVVHGRRFVVLETNVERGSWLDGLPIGEAMDQHGLAVMSLERAGQVVEVGRIAAVRAGDHVVLQCSYETFKAWRAEHKPNRNADPTAMTGSGILDSSTGALLPE